MADDDLGPHAQLVEKRAQTEAERLDAHQVDLLLEQPARVVFAKARGLDHGLRFIGEGVGLSGTVAG